MTQTVRQQSCCTLVWKACLFFLVGELFGKVLNTKLVFKKTCAVEADRRSNAADPLSVVRIDCTTHLLIKSGYVGLTLGYPLVCCKHISSTIFVSWGLT